NSNHVHSKKPCLVESDHNNVTDLKTKEGNNNSSLSQSGVVDSEYFNAQESLTKKERYRIHYSWENVIDQIDFRSTSKDDWVYETYNLSSEFRKFQKLTIEQIKKNPILCYKADIQKILSLSNIMLIEHIKPSFLTVTQTIWDQIYQRKLPPSLAPVVTNIALEYSSMLNSFTPLNVIQDTWCNNFSKIAGLTDQEDKDKFCQAQIIFRNFLLLRTKCVNTNNEDTFVHETLHDLLKEIFRDSMFELIWANSESLVSKNQRSNSSSNKENLRGEKPDFKIVANTKEEILFGEVKTKDSSSLLVNKDFVKLSNFQSSALDELIKKYGNRSGLTSFGIWICGEWLNLAYLFNAFINMLWIAFIGARICIYEMDINHDGIYRMFLMANVVTPTEQAQFLCLIPVLEALYNVKDHINKVLKVIASDTSSDTSSSSSRSTYTRIPIPSPKLIKIAIIGSKSN
ncbi:14861_t:CDS:2, partial [Entrophospora sp. SA101]